MTETVQLDQRVARMVAAGSLTLVMVMLLVTGATLAGAGASGRLPADGVVLLVLLAGSVAARHRSSIARGAVGLAVPAAIVVGAWLGVFGGYLGPEPGPAVFAWTRLVIAFVAGAAALVLLIRLRRPVADSVVPGLLSLSTGYWLACMGVGYLA